MINEVHAKFILKCIITTSSFSLFLENDIITEYDLPKHNYQLHTEPLTNINSSQDLCYVMFTSGTTGKPKGTLISHDNLVNFCLYSLTDSGKTEYFDGVTNVLAIAKFTYTIHINEIFFPLMKHKTIILCSYLESNNPMFLGQLLVKHQVEAIGITPSRITNYLSNEKLRKTVASIKIFIFGGEMITREFIQLMKNYTPNTKLLTGYGLTETVCISTLTDLNAKDTIPSVITMSSPVCNSEVYILDDDLHPVPIGVEGEIYIAGCNVGQGYLNLDQMSKERFLDCPFLPERHSRKMYRTGDMGYWTEHGEIENSIKEIEGIDYVVVLDRERDQGDKYLVAYYLSATTLNSRKIREFLKKKLPMYMIPSFFIKLDRIPMTFHGKLDRKALPEPCERDLLKENYAPPETEIEEYLCRFYSQSFNYQEDEVGRWSDFYELGGNSLNALTIISRINKIYEKRDQKEFPITSQQLGVYLDSIKNENSTLYNIPFIIKLSKGVSIEKIELCFEKIFQNHEILRSKYHEKEVDGKIEIYGFIDDECSLTFEEYNYENYKTFVRPFDLRVAPLIRVGFISDEVLMIDCHHIISDGRSMAIIMKELEELYNNQDVPSLDIQFSDYAQYLNDKKNNEYYEKQLSYYQEMFNCDYEIVQLPVKESNKEENTENIGKYERIIDKSMTESINKFIQNHGISKTAFFIILYGYILSKYSGQKNIYSSVLTANRNNYYVENMIGMFVSTHPILLNFSNRNVKFIEMIKENMNNLINIYENEEISFMEISEALKLKKVNNAFIYQPNVIKIDRNDNKKRIFSFEESENQEIYSLYENNNLEFDITFNVIEKENEYAVALKYNDNIYSNYLIKQIVDSYIEIINNISQFDNKIKTIEYIPKEEKDRIIIQFNDTEYKKNCNKFYHEEFSKIASKNPDICAIIFNDVKYSYGKLDLMSNSLAHYIRSLGVNRNDIIPIICNRTPYYIIGTLAISKAGGAFLPVDPKLPIERIQYIIEEVHPKLILRYRNEEIVNELNKNDYEILDIENYDYDKNNNNGPLEFVNESDDTCYVLFTSGTTGKPKGVLINHFNIFNNLRRFGEENEHLGLGNFLLKENQIENILGITNFTFDISHNEITFSLMHGLTLILADDNLGNDINALSNYIIKNNVEFINTTPTRFKLFMENEEFRKALSIIKVIVFIGEELPRILCENIHKYSNCEIYNGYGPTECTVTCTYKKIDEVKESKITIGKPQCNYKLYILDEEMNICPVGVVGEIYISGYGTGKGYLNREELTKEKFIPCPYNNNGDKYNEIMYRTGDLGKWTKEGEIEYLGRIDFQVKIHGQRIELGEIESVIREMEEIQQAVVIDKKKERGDKYLICYFISGNEITGKEIRNYLKKKLPMYMIPNFYKEIQEILLLSNGKLNRKGLPEPSLEDLIKEEYIAPESETEKKLCKIYGEIFYISEKEIGQMSDFYELGGDSLNAIRLISKIEKEWIYRKKGTTSFHDSNSSNNIKVRTITNNRNNVIFCTPYSLKVYAKELLFSSS
ncbi:hypothetical protein PIROE2DRAFT_17019 [Piromyces sp. E2]|nr:hypothetical protein PIROE2DRAFT_17019 [Piromyces sp. E2]|eukprot:OUM57866.1 hypothetical protein PIROE2DRAFT_17019 [Piromyces sp. E2]